MEMYTYISDMTRQPLDDIEERERTIFITYARCCFKNTTIDFDEFWHELLDRNSARFNVEIKTIDECTKKYIYSINGNILLIITEMIRMENNLRTYRLTSLFY